MSIVYNKDIRIYYEIFGDRNCADSLIFISGAGSDLTFWDRQIGMLSDLYFIVAMDNRGSGKSDCPPMKYSAELMADDVHCIMEAEGVEHATCIGFSLGGLIAQRFVNDYPSKVRRLILINCTLGAGNPNTILPDSRIMNMFLFASALSVDDCVKNAIDFNFGPSLQEENPQLYKSVYDHTVRNSRGIPNQIPVMVSPSQLIEDYAKITIPVLHILSKQDPVIPWENGEVTRNYIPHARIEYLEGFHASPQIHPETVGTLINTFINTTKAE